MKAWSPFLLVAGWLILLTTGRGETRGRVLSDTKITFDREIVLRILPPCTLEAEGSKLTVEPVNLTYADFSKSVAWQIGEPRYLAGTPPSARKYDFDLAQRVTFTKEMVLRIFRTTQISTTEGIVVICKDSVCPKIQK